MKDSVKRKQVVLSNFSVFEITIEKMMINLVKNFINLAFKTKIRAAISIFVVLILGFLGWRTFGQQVKKPQYQTAQAQQGTLVQSVTGSGTISAGNSVGITTDATGLVTNVYVKNGDTVTEGEKIADIQPDQATQAKLASSWASYVSALNTLKTDQNNQHTAEINLEKTLDDIHLFQYGNGGFSNVGSSNETETQKQDRTQAQEAKNNADIAVNTAQTQVNSAWLAYQQISPAILAPMSGIISNLTITPGLSIAPSGAGSNSNSSSTTTSSSSNSQSLGTVTLQQSQLEATVDLSEIDVVNVKAGQKATLTLDAFPNKTFTGRVLTIDTNGVVNSGVTTYPVTIALDTALNNIYPNMAVNATIITNIKNNVLLVPTEAVQTNNGIATVRVLKAGQIQDVQVSVGDSNDTQTEITSGLNEGDTVITGVSNSAGGRATTSPFGINRGFGGGAFFRGRGG